ncbi:MAG: response regulator [Chloroflexota bacterium]
MSTISAAPRVQVVDDDQTSRQVVVDLLQDEGYEAVAVPDADTALAMIAPHWWPDLILLGGSMVGVGGVAFAQAYRRVPGTHAPIILLTDTPGIDAAKHTEELGAVGFLRKPVDGDALKALVRRHLPPQPVGEELASDAQR